MKIVHIIQARMGSTRLKDKVLLPILGKPMLQVVVERARKAKRLNEVVVATTILAQDDPIVALAQSLKIPVLRGSENDCLDRYYQTMRQFGADVVVRATSDNTFVDAGLIDWGIGEFLAAKADHADTWTDTLPLGLRIEVIRAETLAQAWREDNNPSWREHVTPYIINHPEKFHLLKLGVPPVAGTTSHDTANFGALRWSVDTAEDYAMTTRTFEHFGNLDFAWREAAEWLMAHPEVASINQNVQQKLHMFVR